MGAYRSMPISSQSGFRVRPANPAGVFTYSAPVESRGQPPAHAAPATETPGVYRCAPGPWGDIEYQYIYLEAAEELVSHFAMPSTQPRWSFPGASVEQLSMLFDTARLPADWIESWLSPQHLLVQNGVLHVLP